SIVPSLTASPHRPSVGTLQQTGGPVATPGTKRDTGRPTLETVARRAGVSRSLFSLVLNDSPKFSQASRDAVRQAVADLGYRPNAAARRLAWRRARTGGVLLNALRPAWDANIAAG